MTRARETSAATFVSNSKSLPHRLRINSEQIADIDESKRPVAPLGCDPFESLRGLAVRHAASNSLKATHSVLEYCRGERYLREAHACPVGREVRGKSHAVIGDRRVVPRGLIGGCLSPLVSEHSVTSVKPSITNM